MPMKASSRATTIATQRHDRSPARAAGRPSRSRPMPRDALSSTRSPTPGASSRSSTAAASSASSAVTTRGAPAARAASAIQRPRGPTATIPSAAPAACAPISRCRRSSSGPSSSMSPSTASRRRPAASGVSARKSSAPATLTGEALYVSSTSGGAGCGFDRRPCGALRGCRPPAPRRPRRAGTPKRSADGRRGQRVRDEVAPRRGARDPARAPRGVERELGAGQARATRSRRRARRRPAPSPKVRTSAARHRSRMAATADHRR